ncbi:MAG: DoxX family protein [gamma proteobacterium symbiont of Lucinoma myriamae]|nr:DoxX family protein [gamma proteobacterium symbiont of Lucinoma myriamae]
MVSDASDILVFRLNRNRCSNWAGIGVHVRRNTHEYNVPFLNPELAAWMGTAAELTLPVILVIGILSRPVALALFAFNAIAAFSYPDISPAGIVDHIMWGVMLAAIFFHGAGKLSLDHLVLRKILEKKTIKFQLNNQAELVS